MSVLLKEYAKGEIMEHTIKSPDTANIEADNSKSCYPYELQVHYTKLNDTLGNLVEVLSSLEQQINEKAVPQDPIAGLITSDKEKMTDVLNLLCEGNTLRTELSNLNCPLSPAKELERVVGLLKKLGVPIQTKLRPKERVWSSICEAQLLCGDSYYLEKSYIEGLGTWFEMGLSLTIGKEVKQCTP
jgi:hypothetical protein